MNRFIDETCDAVDASVFSGDALYDDATREEFKRLLERWSRQVDRWSRCAEEWGKSAPGDKL